MTQSVVILDSQDNRKLRHPGNANRFALMVYLLFALLGTLAIVAFLRQSAYQDSIVRDGKVTTGTVIDSGDAAAPGEGNDYYLTYQFAAKSGDEPTHFYSKSQSVSAASYFKYGVQSQVTVAYLPSDPTQSRLAGPDQEPQVNFINLWSPLLVVGVVWALALHQIRLLYRERAWARKGQPEP